MALRLWVRLVEANEEDHLSNHTHLPCTAMFLILRKNSRENCQLSWSEAFPLL